MSSAPQSFDDIESNMRFAAGLAAGDQPALCRGTQEAQVDMVAASFLSYRAIVSRRVAENVSPTIWTR